MSCVNTSIGYCGTHFLTGWKTLRANALLEMVKLAFTYFNSFFERLELLVWVIVMSCFQARFSTITCRWRRWEGTSSRTRRRGTRCTDARPSLTGRSDAASVSTDAGTTLILEIRCVIQGATKVLLCNTYSQRLWKLCLMALVKFNIKTRLV